MPTLVSRQCPLCDSDLNSELFTKHHLTVVRCDNCSMAFANPVEEEFVNGLFYDQLANPFYLSPDKLLSDYAPVRFERELKLFRRFCKSGAVLDVGCSTGAFLFQLRQRFGDDYRTLGIDVSGPALDYAEKQGTKVLREPFLAADFNGRRFSAITFWAVMEHLAKPREFLAKAASLLEDGGMCFILAPNFRSLAVRLIGKKYRYIFPQHINYFTSDTLRRLAATQSGFETMALKSTHFNPLVIWKDWRQPRDFVPDEERAKLLKRTTAYKQSPIMKPLKLALNAAELVFGRFELADNLAIVLKKRQKQ